jgi:hypothetical protein
MISPIHREKDFGRPRDQSHTFCAGFGAGPGISSIPFERDLGRALGSGTYLLRGIWGGPWDGPSPPPLFVNHLHHCVIVQFVVLKLDNFVVIGNHLQGHPTPRPGFVIDPEKFLHDFNP